MSDARASLDRAKKTFSENTNVQIFDQKRQPKRFQSRLNERLLRNELQSESRTRQDSNEPWQITMPETTTATTADTAEHHSEVVQNSHWQENNHNSSNHQLVRRYTEDLDNERIFLEQQHAKSKFL